MLQSSTLIGNELRAFQINANPHEASNSVSSVGLSWEHMKIYEKYLRPTSSASSFPLEERTSGFPIHVLKEVSALFHVQEQDKRPVLHAVLARTLVLADSIDGCFRPSTDLGLWITAYQ